MSNVKTVLVVEDNKDLLFTTCSIIKGYGFRVVFANNAQDALSYLCCNEAPDIVFTDVHMPGPIDGLELAKIVMKKHPSIKVMMASGHLEADKRIEGLPFFVKPYLVDNVVAQIKVLTESYDI